MDAIRQGQETNEKQLPDVLDSSTVSLDLKPSTPQPPRRSTSVVLWGLAMLVAIVVLGPAVGRMGRRTLGDYYLARADVAYWDDDLPAALRLVDRAAAMMPDEPTCLFARARYRFEAGRYQDSLDDYEALLRLSPSFADGHIGRGTVLQRLGRHGEAVEEFQEALRLSPRALGAGWNNLAYARALHGQLLDEAFREVERAIQLDEGPPNPLFLDTRGFIKHKLGRHAEALEDLNTAVDGLEIRLRELEPANRQNTPHKAISARRAAKLLKLERQRLAVLLHHRALIHAALGDAARADADAARAQDLGFEPGAGDG